MQIRSRKDGSHHPITPRTGVSLHDFERLQAQDQSRRALITNLPDLPTTYDDFPAWFERKAKEYGGRNEFASSEEYKRVFPIISAMRAQKVTELKDKYDKILAEAGVKYGDKLEYSAASPFGAIIELEGILVNKDGVPKIKITKNTSHEKVRYRNWHNGWRKIK